MPDPAIGQREAINKAIDAAETAVAAVNNNSLQQVTTADGRIADARAAIDAAAHVPDPEKTAFTGTVDALATRLRTAKTARTAAMTAAQQAADKAVMEKAGKLHKGILAPYIHKSSGTTSLASPSGMVPVAGYRSNTIPQDSELEIRYPQSTRRYNLKEDTKTKVAPNRGWAGKRFTLNFTGSEYLFRSFPKGTLEAIVYSDIEEPKQGKKFGSPTANDNYEYTLDATNNTELTISTSDTAVQERIARSSFDQTAGKKEFKLPDNTKRVLIPGSYHGVLGTYYCAPATDETCSASVAAEGFTLANGTWTFKATSNEARVLSAPDGDYASYGWWLFKSADGKTYYASVLTDEHIQSVFVGVPSASGITALRGTATYKGGAAGHYAFHSITGGANDAGRFTARATLEANFNTDKVTGVIDQFTGANGQSRNWSVALKESGISDGGVILGTDGSSNASNNPMKTVWRIGDTAAAESGKWAGVLMDNGTDNVPKVGIGTFYTEYGNGGKMVGGFGVNCTTCAMEDS